MANKIKGYIFFTMGVLIGIIVVSTLRHGELNWLYIGRTIGILVLLLFLLFLLCIGIKKVNNQV